jgi:signal transduction histidine kinase
MIFNKISYRIAAQFTGFVFGLLVLTGLVFIAADAVNRHRENYMRLHRELTRILDHPAEFGVLPQIPKRDRDRIRIVDANANNLFSGGFFEEIPFLQDEGLTSIILDGEFYDILTVAVRRDEALVGYIQVADRAPPNDLIFRTFLFLLISGAISGLTFGVGLFFARRSLKPAQQMMERLEQFTQDASHELRTPLTAVSTSLDMALVTQENADYIRTAKKDLKDVVTLVERLLELAQLDKLALQTEPVALQPLIEEVIAKHRAAAEEKKVEINEELSPVHVHGDQALLRQVVGNLLSNAIKFNTTGGHVVIRLTPKSLVVEDTGKGISEEALPRIFERFYQEDAARTKPAKGIGLGLALVKRIVDLHGWTISIRSKKGKGTTFTVHFANVHKGER